MIQPSLPHLRKILLGVSICSSFALLQRMQAQTVAPDSLQINIWHGLHQRVGHLGRVQADFNLTGSVTSPAGIFSLMYVLNGGIPVQLTVGDRPDGFGDGRRLAGTGHFNADIPIALLKPGINHVELQARDDSGHRTSVVVTVDRLPGDRPLPVEIDWSTVTHPQDAGQCVDGEWVVTRDGIRTGHTGYDRVYLIGETTWRDYEITVPVTIHRVEPRTGPVSGPNGLGIIFHFQGHVAGGSRNFPVSQPTWGYQPFGSITWLRWLHGADQPPEKQFYRGDNDRRTDHGTFSVVPGNQFRMKARCQALPDSTDGTGVTRYSFKIWNATDAEPAAWDYEETQVSRHALRTGGVVLLAHHVDATFGDVSICAIK